MVNELVKYKIFQTKAEIMIGYYNEQIDITQNEQRKEYFIHEKEKAIRALGDVKQKLKKLQVKQNLFKIMREETIKDYEKRVADEQNPGRKEWLKMRKEEMEK